MMRLTTRCRRLQHIFHRALLMSRPLRRTRELQRLSCALRRRPRLALASNNRKFRPHSFPSLVVSDFFRSIRPASAAVTYSVILQLEVEPWESGL